MSRFIYSFSEEIEKISEEAPRSNADLKKLLRAAREDRTSDEDDFDREVRSSLAQTGKNYAGTMALGAASGPLIDIAGAATARRIDHGKKGSGALGATRKLVGHASKNPLVSHGQLAGSAVRGAIVGGVVQALRDKLLSPKDEG